MHTKAQKIKFEIIDSCLRLPITIDAQKALAEVNAIPQEHWDQFRSPVHNNVKSVFLKGHPPVAGIPEDDERTAMSFTPYLRSIINSLPGKPAKALVAVLSDKGIIPVHCDGSDLEGTDPISTYFNNTLRIHMVLQTNKDALFFCNSNFFHMAEGEVWTLNNLSEHGVINQNPTEKRIHVIFDIYPDETTEEYLKQCQHIEASKHPELVKKLMENSCAPAESLYALGKSVPTECY